MKNMRSMELSVKFDISFDKHQIYHQLIFSLKSYAKEKLITVRIIDEKKN